MKRRNFLAAAPAALLAIGHAQDSRSAHRAAVIGHTGRGNYGHGLDKVWQLVDGVEIVAVADGNPAGLLVEQAKLGLARGYTDYQQMLAEVKPEFVSVAPRHVDQHHNMTLAAIEAGVRGIYVDKPFCRTPAEADSLIKASKKAGTKIAVAHRNRYHPTLAHVETLLKEGAIGKLLELRGRGLGDHRGGGEDLWVLGCHIMNLIHHFAGKPISCSGMLLQQGRRVTRDDVKPGAEGLGPLAADEVHARYEMAGGVVAYYDSIANDGTNKNGYCLQLIGSKGIIAIHIDRDPVAHLMPGNPFAISSEPRRWIPITSAGLDQPESAPELVKTVHNHVIAVRNLIDACENDRAPLCDIHAGTMTVEMICAVFESHRQESRAVEFPLKERGNALERL